VRAIDSNSNPATTAATGTVAIGSNSGNISTAVVHKGGSAAAASSGSTMLVSVLQLLYIYLIISNFTAPICLHHTLLLQALSTV
jgi:hypothetical protein